MDFHKRKATADLWNNNGKSTPKHTRYKGKARMQSKQLIKQQLIEDFIESDPDRLITEMLNEEADEAMYCHQYGPCDRCLQRSQVKKA